MMQRRKNNEVSVWIPIIAVIFIVITMMNMSNFKKKINDVQSNDNYRGSLQHNQPNH